MIHKRIFCFLVEKSNLLFFILVFVMPLLHISADNENWSVSEINPELLVSNPAVVKRFESLEFDVKDPGNATMNVRRVYTIMNKEGAKWAEQKIFYSQFVKIKRLSAMVYNGSGIEIGDVSKKQFEDYLAYDGISFLQENRVKYINLEQMNFPFTIELIYSTEKEGLLFYPLWNPFESSVDMAVSHSEYKLIVPSDIKINLDSYLIDQKPLENKVEDKISYTWKIESQPPIKVEAMGPSQFPILKISPSVFEMGGYNGGLDSWESFGSFIYKLNEGRDEIPQETIIEIKELIGSETDTLKIIEKVYNFVQENSRYLSITLGLGGWQPRTAEEVDADNLGDCKALSNYTKALLKNCGIGSYYTLINAGRNPRLVKKDFPSPVFNHAVLTVPLLSDTIHLECTSKTSPIDFHGSFTDDRYALLIKENSSELYKTKSNTAEENRRVQNAKIKLLEDGNAEAEIRYEYFGNRQGFPRMMINEVSSEKEKEEYLMDYMGIPSFELIDYELNANDTKPYSSSLSTQLKIRKFASKAGSRWIFSPNIDDVYLQILPSTKNRKFNLINKRAYCNIDTCIIEIPEGFEIENYESEPKSLNGKFGSLEVKFELLDNKQLIFTRKLIKPKFDYPPEVCEEYQEFAKQVIEMGNTQVVLKQK